LTSTRIHCSRLDQNHRLHRRCRTVLRVLWCPSRQRPVLAPCSRATV
jgi:hypothetical protein